MILKVGFKNFLFNTVDIFRERNEKLKKIMKKVKKLD